MGWLLGIAVLCWAITGYSWSQMHGDDFGAAGAVLVFGALGAVSTLCYLGMALYLHRFW